MVSTWCQVHSTREVSVHQHYQTSPSSEGLLFQFPVKQDKLTYNATLAAIDVDRKTSAEACNHTLQWDMNYTESLTMPFLGYCGLLCE